MERVKSFKYFRTLLQFGQLETGIIPKPQGFVLRFFIGHEIDEEE
jgi:hypothetical protein